MNAASKCLKCEKVAYPNERVVIDEAVYHKTCFKCTHCTQRLTMSGFAMINGNPYCKPHFKQLFQSSGGKYDRAFGTTFSNSSDPVVQARQSGGTLRVQKHSPRRSSTSDLVSGVESIEIPKNISLTLKRPVASQPVTPAVDAVETPQWMKSKLLISDKQDMVTPEKSPKADSEKTDSESKSAELSHMVLDRPRRTSESFDLPRRPSGSKRVAPASGNTPGLAKKAATKKAATQLVVTNVLDRAGELGAHDEQGENSDQGNPETDSVDKLKEEIADLQRDRSSSEKVISELQRQNAASVDKMKDLEESLDTQKEINTSLKDFTTRLTSELQEFEASRELEEGNEEVKVSAASETEAELRSKIAALEKQADKDANLRYEVDRLEKENLSLKGQATSGEQDSELLEQASIKLEEYATREKELLDKIASLEDENQSLEERVETLAQESQSDSQKEKDLRSKIQSLEAENKSIEERVRNFAEESQSGSRKEGELALSIKSLEAENLALEERIRNMAEESKASEKDESVSADTAEHLQKLQDDNEALEESIVQLRASLDACGIDKRAEHKLKKRMKKLEKELEGVRTELAETKERAEDADETVEIQTEKIRALTTKLAQVLK